MESAISTLPQVQGQQQGDIGSSQAAAAAAATAASSSSSSSGSIGPFFAVISVLTVLAIVSCVVGRICIRRRTAVPVTPLDTIKDGGCLGWLKRKCRHCMAGEMEVGAKVMSFGDDKNNNAHRPQEIEDLTTYHRELLFMSPGKAFNRMQGG
ncbi:uncharacterized protein LOC111290315 [Durio zibethinus]|uniref:Uncharacterized protein LOC111290315 n=1 Tax=Durio zibethinus TaxID=66656 RepID=A0A6P5YA60_DURZI|nr:uncharacterized protein LOC111290315 [Durio zibethinus]